MNTTEKVLEEFRRSVLCLDAERWIVQGLIVQYERLLELRQLL